MQPRKRHGSFKDYDLGFVHADVQHLSKLRTADGEIRLHLAIGCCSRFVHLDVYDAENAITFLETARKAFPFRITHVLTDRDPASQLMILNAPARSSKSFIAR